MPVTLTLDQLIALLGVSFTVLSGAFAGINILIRRWLQRSEESQVVLLQRQVQTLQDDKNQLSSSLQKLTTEHDQLDQRLIEAKRDLEQATEQLGELRTENEQLQIVDKRLRTLDNRIRRTLQMEGQIWTQKVMCDPPRFVPRRERETPIVSLLNLKGGVGKTTLTANLAWALSNRGYRVLLVDLDLQGSLSSYLLHTEKLNHLDTREELLQHFLVPKKPELATRPKRTPLLSYAQPVPQMNPHCRVIATSDRLAYAEMNLTVRWLLRVGQATRTWNGRSDARMILRKALHQKRITKNFDIVLLDCPPLINLSCVNALAASDTILIPAIPNHKSIERIPPLLERVKEIRSNLLNTELTVLGIVANRTRFRELTKSEADLFINLPDISKRLYGQSVDLFDTVIQQRSTISGTEEEYNPHVMEEPVQQMFETFTEEFISRLSMDPPRPVRSGRANNTVRPGDSL